jgi:hypothetical protein
MPRVAADPGGATGSGGGLDLDLSGLRRAGLTPIDPMPFAML